jgi:hypothetical protein
LIGQKFSAKSVDLVFCYFLGRLKSPRNVRHGFTTVVTDPTSNGDSYRPRPQTKYCIHRKFKKNDFAIYLLGLNLPNQRSET